jgi:hypothetical protein
VSNAWALTTKDWHERFASMKPAVGGGETSQEKKPTDELSDEQLDKVAGGDHGPWDPALD